MCSARIVQTECNRACSILLRCSLCSARIVQTEYNRACSILPRRSLTYAMLVQVECNRACSILPRRSLTYAKIIIFFFSFLYIPIRFRKILYLILFLKQLSLFINMLTMYIIFIYYAGGMIDIDLPSWLLQFSVQPSYFCRTF